MGMKEIPVEQAWKRKYPEQVALATTVSKSGKSNVIALGWAMPTSFEPPMAAISVGKSRYSHQLLVEVPEFVLCFPSVHQKDAMVFCGTHSGRDHDKFAETGLQAVPARRVRPPVIDGSVAAFECRVTASLETGDHTIFAGEILSAYVNDEPVPRIYNFGEIFKGIA